MKVVLDLAKRAGVKYTAHYRKKENCRKRQQTHSRQKDEGKKSI